MGFSPVFVRIAEVDAFASAFWRVVFALPVLLAWAFLEVRKNAKRFSLKVNLPAILAGIFFAGDLAFWHLSILNTSMANATFLVCLASVWVALLSSFFLGEKPSRVMITGLGICVVGMVLLIHSSLRLEPERLIGDIYGLITSVFLGLYFIAIRAGRKTSQSGELFFVSTCVTAIVLLAVALIMGGNFFPETSKGWASLVSLGVLTHAGGQGLVTAAMGVLTAMFSSLVIFIEAIAAAAFGWWLFDEKLDAIQLAGGFLILVGVWISKPSDKTQPQS